ATSPSATAAAAKSVPANPAPASAPAASAPAASAPAASAPVASAVADPATADPAAEPSLEQAVAELKAPPAVSTNVPVAPPQAEPPTAPVTLQHLKDAWPEVLEIVQKASMNAWTVVFTAQVRALDGDILRLAFTNQTDYTTFRELNPAGEGVSSILRSAIIDVLGMRVKFIATVAPAAATQQTRPAVVAPPVSAPVAAPVDDEAPDPIEPDVEPGGWSVAAIPPSAPTEQEMHAARAAARKPAVTVAPVPTAQDSRYGEAVVREILGASFVEEQPIAPRVVPKDV
ncbi:MAG: polymerase subunit gamma and tau, partial [Microbacteriaceae bacterium]|nr:polymerase subunit gamma and tau [Microbacteriaceae bacterium]